MAIQAQRPQRGTSISPELKSKIDSAIRETGSMRRAAELLGLTYGGLRGMVHKDPELRARYTKPNKGKKGAAKEAARLDEPVSADLVELGREQDIKPVGGEVLITDKRVSEALAREDANLSEGLEAIGLSPSAVKSAQALQEFHGTHFTKAIEIIGGGMTKTFVEIMAEVNHLNARLEEGGLTLEEEQMLRQDRSRLLEIQGRTYDRAQKAAMTQAVIKHKLSETSEGGAKRGKPGFSPIVNAIKIEAENVKVTPDEG